MSENSSPDALKDLVKFLVCLAILGAMVALVAYFAVVLPHDAAIQAPTNFVGPQVRTTITPIFFIPPG